MAMENERHYDHVTDAWQDIMGNNFHFGYFESPDVSLAQATNALIDKMDSLVNITEETRVLDVGCGIGEPAMYLANKHNCSIVGITTSAKGVETARQRCQVNGHRLEFKVADGTNNGEPDNSYDVVWVMESSHLMNKRALLKECYRVLKPKGTLILCDLMSIGSNPISNIYKIIKSNIKYNDRSVYGKVITRPIGFYWRMMHKLGFNEITTVDVSKEMFPTMEHWRRNVLANEAALLSGGKFTKKEYDDYLKSCDRLEMIFDQRVIGYAIIKATKP